MAPRKKQSDIRGISGPTFDDSNQAPVPEKQPEVSPYTEFFNWLFSDTNSEPTELVCKKINPTILLNYFKPTVQNKSGKGYSRYYKTFLGINNLFNNFNYADLPTRDIIICLKKILDELKGNGLYFSKYKQDEKDDVLELYTELRLKYPLLKSFEVYNLCNIINDQPDEIKDKIYESVGISLAIKKTKIKQSKNKQQTDIYTLQDLLAKFELKEVK